MPSYSGAFVAQVSGVDPNNGLLTVLIPQVFQGTGVVMDKWVGRRPVPGEQGYVVFINGDSTWPVWIGSQVIAVSTDAAGDVVEVIEGGGSPEVWVAPNTPPDPEYLLWYDTDAAATVGLRPYTFAYSGVNHWNHSADNAWDPVQYLTRKEFDKDNLVTATTAKTYFTAPRDGLVHFNASATLFLGSETVTGWGLFVISIWTNAGELVRGQSLSLNLQYLPAVNVRLWGLSVAADVKVTAGTQYYPALFANAASIAKTWNLDVPANPFVESQFSGRYTDY